MKGAGMSAKEFVSRLGPLDPQEASVMFFYLAEHVREAQLADGNYLCLVADFSDWLRELAEASIAKAVADNPTGCDAAGCSLWGRPDLSSLRTHSPGSLRMRRGYRGRTHLSLRDGGASMTTYAILVIQKNGCQDYLCERLTNTPSRFPSRAAAQRQVDFMEIGMKGDVQSINIVKYPKEMA